MRRRPLAVVAAAVLAALVLAAVARGPRPSGAIQAVDAQPRTFPQLAGVTLPPNIAAPAIRIDEPGTAWYLEAHGERGPHLAAGRRRPGLVLGLRNWRRLLRANAGGSITLTISVRDAAGRWTRFAPLTADVAAEPVDRYLVYRQLTPLYNLATEIGVYQRDLTGYGTRLVLHGRQLSTGCPNCHTFWQGDGRRFTLAVRSREWGGGTLLVDGSRVTRIKQSVGYGAWHPNGKLLAFTTTMPRQFFHTAGPDSREPLDLRAQLVLYDVAQRRFTAIPGLSSSQDLTTQPCWSPDGRWLYFSQTRRPWRDDTPFPPPTYDQVHYSLKRVAYDPDTGAWGQPELLRSGDQAGRSLIYPRVSPDGRWLLYTSTDHGNFGFARPSSELALIDLQTGADVPVGLHREGADSWHSWSRNGRWIVFASRRADGLFERLYLSYFDTDGHFHPPLRLPQRDPWYDDTFWYSYNVPELISEPIGVNAGRLGRAARRAPTVDAPLPPEVAPPRPQER
jgi:hypothetical protein